VMVETHQDIAGAQLAQQGLSRGPLL
jgi:hypothetical protein